MQGACKGAAARDRLTLRPMGMPAHAVPQWGGETEIVILAAHYRAEIAVVNCETMRVLVYGQGAEPEPRGRVYILYTGRLAPPPRGTRAAHHVAPELPATWHQSCPPRGSRALCPSPRGPLG